MGLMVVVGDQIVQMTHPYPALLTPPSNFLLTSQPQPSNVLLHSATILGLRLFQQLHPLCLHLPQPPHRLVPDLLNLPARLCLQPRPHFFELEFVSGDGRFDRLDLSEQGLAEMVGVVSKCIPHVVLNCSSLLMHGLHGLGQSSQFMPVGPSILDHFPQLLQLLPMPQNILQFLILRLNSPHIAEYHLQPELTIISIALGIQPLHE
jgi:hypothetical protein